MKIAVSALVIAAACSAALVFGLKREASLETGSIAAMTPASEPAPVIRNERLPAPGAAETIERKEIENLKPTRQANAAAPLAELAGQADGPAADQSAPSFDLARIEETGEAVIAGRAAPGAIVELLRDGERLDRVLAEPSGDFVMVPHLPAGNYELTLSARSPNGTLASSKKGVMVSVNNAASGPGVAQSRAEYIPESGSQARPSLQTPLQASKPPQKLAFEPAQVSAGHSVSEENVSSTAAIPRNVARVARGDSLWRISRITYGDGARYAIVYHANRDRIRDPNLIHPGQILTLPAGNR